MFKLLSKKNKEMNPNIWIIAGLGNPGPEYYNTRHNCGFRSIDKIKEKIAPDKTEQQKFRGKYIQCSYDNSKVILLKPETYMNNSGESIQAAMNWFKTDESHLIVIFDDFDIESGHIRIRPKGSAGTHNGMKSVLQYTNTDEFARIRVGIGKKNRETDVIKFVLGNFTEEERVNMERAFERAAEAALYIIKNGTENAMNHFNAN